MTKDAYYFSHDANARHDPKMIRLRSKLGMEGVGIFWCIVEMLRESGDYKLSLNDCDGIAYGLHCRVAIAEAVVKDFDLFEIDGDKFWSNTLLQRMEKREIFLV